jgi:hypothetical protein
MHPLFIVPQTPKSYFPSFYSSPDLIIITGKAALSSNSSPCKVLPEPIFTYLDFTTILLYRKELLSALRPTPNTEDQISAFMSSSDRVAQFYLQTPGSLSIASTTCGAAAVVF